MVQPVFHGSVSIVSGDVWFDVFDVYNIMRKVDDHFTLIPRGYEYLVVPLALSLYILYKEIVNSGTVPSV